METPVILLLLPRAWDLGFPPPTNPCFYKQGWETSPLETPGISRCLRPKFHSISSLFPPAIRWPRIYQSRDSKLVLFIHRGGANTDSSGGPLCLSLRPAIPSIFRTLGLEGPTASPFPQSVSLAAAHS